MNGNILKRHTIVILRLNPGSRLQRLNLIEELSGRLVIAHTPSQNGENIAATMHKHFFLLNYNAVEICGIAKFEQCLDSSHLVCACRPKNRRTQPPQGAADYPQYQ